LSDTLTESFCERCGTRYEFHAPTRLNPLRRTRGVIGGLKNYLTSQDAMGDAMRDAMRQEEEALAAAQLDVFHASFNFCIDCRQYTCVNCWNDDAGRCRSCSPIPGTDDLAERLAVSMDGGAAVAEPVLAEDEVQRRLGLAGWPTSDLPGQPTVGGHPEVAWPQTDVSSGAAEAETEAEPVAAAAEADIETQPQPISAEAEPPPVLRVVAWEDDAPHEVLETETEPERVAAETPEPEPIAAETLEPERVAAETPEPERVAAETPEPEPIAAETLKPERVAAETPEPEPVAAARIAPISETILRFPDRERPAEAEPATQAAEQESPEIAARRAQLDLLGLGDVGEGPVDGTRPAVLPYRSRGATPSPAELAARARAGGTGFWEASAREVAGAPAAIGIQNCGECGLSLSASARFCRRCGTRQARSA
jgi:hypothetical protein